jgi:hypothetical protein
MLADPADPRLDGSACLPSALASHLPLDLVILMLGTNEMKACFHRSAFEIAAGRSKPVGQVLSSAGGVGTAYPAPPPYLHVFRQCPCQDGPVRHALRRPCGFQEGTGPDTGAIISTDAMDGLHVTAETNLALGKALVANVRTIVRAGQPALA